MEVLISAFEDDGQGSAEKPVSAMKYGSKFVSVKDQLCWCGTIRSICWRWSWYRYISQASLIDNILKTHLLPRARRSLSIYSFPESRDDLSRLRATLTSRAKKWFKLPFSPRCMFIQIQALQFNFIQKSWTFESIDLKPQKSDDISIFCFSQMSHSCWFN